MEYYTSQVETDLDVSILTPCVMEEAIDTDGNYTRKVNIAWNHMPIHCLIYNELCWVS